MGWVGFKLGFGSALLCYRTTRQQVEFEVEFEVEVDVDVELYDLFLRVVLLGGVGGFVRQITIINPGKFSVDYLWHWRAPPGPALNLSGAKKV